MQPLRARLAQPNKVHLAALDEPAHLADRILDRHAGVDAVLVIEVDRIETEPLQTGIAGLTHVFGAAVDAVGAAGVAGLAELGRDHEVIAPFPLQRAADQLLVLAPAIHVGAVEMIDPEIDRAMDQLDPGRVIARPVSAGQRHAAEPDRQHLRPVLADPPPPALSAVAHPILPQSRAHHSQHGSFSPTAKTAL